MFRTVSLCLVMALAGGVVSASESSSESETTVDFLLQHSRLADAATAISTIVGTRQFEILPDQVLRVQGSAEVRELARQVVHMIDQGSLETISTYALPSEGEVVVRFRLANAFAPDVMTALRKVVGLKRVVASAASGLVLVRDTPDKTKSAEALVEIMDRACP